MIRGRQSNQREKLFKNAEELVSNLTLDQLNLIDKYKIPYKVFMSHLISTMNVDMAIKNAMIAYSAYEIDGVHFWNYEELSHRINININTHNSMNNNTISEYNKSDYEKYCLIRILSRDNKKFLKSYKIKIESVYSHIDFNDRPYITSNGYYYYNHKQYTSLQELAIEFNCNVHYIKTGFNALKNSKTESELEDSINYIRKLNFIIQLNSTTIIKGVTGLRKYLNSYCSESNVVFEDENIIRALRSPYISNPYNIMIYYRDIRAYKGNKKECKNKGAYYLRKRYGIKGNDELFEMVERLGYEQTIELLSKCKR